VLWSFAFAQPVFDRLASNPTFLSDLRINRASVFMAVALLAFLPPAGLAAMELLVGMWHCAVRRWLHVAIVAVCGAAIALPLVCRVRFLPTLGQLLISLALGALFPWLLRRLGWMRLLVTAAAPAIVVFPAWLLFYSPVTHILFPKSAPMEVSVSNPVPVVMIVLDEFCGAWLMNERGEIDAERFPNFAELARSATWYRNATSVHPYTAYAVPAILTGQYQLGDRRPDSVDHPVNLFTLLFAAGSHDVTAFESGSRLFPDNADPENIYPPAAWPQIQKLLSDLCIVYLHHLVPLDQRWALPRIPRRWFGLLANEDVEPDKRIGVIRYSWDRDRDRQFEHFLSCIEPAPRERPPFYYLHLVLPHSPWNFLPSGRMYHLDSGLGEVVAGTAGSKQQNWGDDEWAITQAAQRYMLQIGYTDHLLGRLLDRVRGAGYFDECLFMLVADHGVSFRVNQPRREPNSENLEDLLPIPWFVKLPHQASGAVDDRNVENVDVLPTVAHILGLSSTISQWDGQSVLSDKGSARSQKQFFTGVQLESVDADFQSRLPGLTGALRRFEFGPGWDGVFRVGPERDLVGKTLSDLEISGRSNLKVDTSRWSGSYDPEGRDPVPCLIEGSVSPAPATGEPQTLAIVVNGTVAAVTRTYRMSGMQHRWAAMISERVLRSGSNELRVFEVRRQDGQRTLWECSTATASK
jgi:hypothetical protein